MSTSSELAKALIKDAAYQKCNLGTENCFYLALEEAFNAGMSRATYDGRHLDFSNVPDFEEWIRIKAYEE